MKFLDFDGLSYFTTKLLAKIPSKISQLTNDLGFTKVNSSTTNGNILIDDKETSVYTLPTASSSALGGVKIGTNVSISNGTISVKDGTTSQKGIVQLTDSTSSTSTTTAATPNSVSSALSSAKSYADDLNDDCITCLSVDGQTITYTKGDGTAESVTIENTFATVETSGSGNAITAISSNNGKLTATKGSTFLTAHPTISTNTDTTSAATASHGGTVTMVDSITRDSNGHVTKVNTKTVTLPSGNNAAGSNLGLVKSGGDVTIADGVITVNDDSHNHIISNVDGLQSALDGKASSTHTHDDKYYTESEIDAKFNAIIGTGASETLDTIGEISKAIEDNQDILDTLNSAIGNKANTSDLTSHTGNTTVHVTSTDKNNWNSAKTHADSAHAPSNAEANQNAFSNVTIGSTTISADTKTDTLTLVGSNVTLTPDATNDKVTIGITKDNVTTALGYTPPTTNTTYSAATSSTLGLVKSGTDITVDSSGNVSVNDNSHKHTVSNISDLTATVAELNYMDGVTSNVQTQLDGKASSGHTHSDATTSTAGLMSASDKSKLDAITENADSVSFTRSLTSGTKVGTITINGSGTDLYAPTNTDTHYESKNVVGATTATSNTTSALTNGNVYLNSVENGVVTSSHKISGSGATTVTTDASGNIIVSSTDNNTTYSAAGSSLGLVKSGGDVTISDGVITVNDDSHNHTIENIDNLQSSLNTITSNLNTHTSNTTSHITSTERTNWNAAYTHSTSTHAPSNAEANQNAFSNIKVGSTTVAADSKTDTLELTGSNITITPDATNDKITFTVADGTTSAKGVVQLTDSTSSTSTTTAATPNSVKSAYDLANTAKTTADSKVGSVSLASGTNNGTLKLTVNGTATDNITVKGLGSAAYTASTDYATSGHTHNYAGSSSAGGSANSAVKLSTARKINNVSFDGTSDIVISDRKYCIVGSDDANTNGWYKVASQTMSGFGDTNVTFVVTSTYAKYYSGIFQLQIRSDNTSISCQIAKWLTRIGFSATDIRIVVSGMTYTMYANQTNNQYGRIMFEVISESSINGGSSGITLYNSTTRETTEPTATVTSSDGATVETANKLTTSRTIQTNLASTSTASFNGSANVTPGVTGTLPIANGGTGATTAAGALTNLGITATAAELNILDGVTATATELNYCDGVKSNIQTQLDGKAASSHGNHVPATETANNAKFLRNDNTWQTVTPANIGAAASSHGTHVSYSTTNPVMDGTASVGTASTVSRSDHVHPTDTSRADANHTHNYAGSSSAGGAATTALTCTGNSATATDADKLDGYHADSFAKLSGAKFTGAVTIQADALNGSYAGLLVGDDCYIGDCNIGNTIGLMGCTNNNIAYVKLGKNGQSLGFNGSNLVYGDSVVVTENNGTASSSKGMIATGFGNHNFTYYQTDQAFDGNAGWCHYLIGNHGNGETQYHYSIGLPFWDTPIYKRQWDGGNSGWQKFYTTENLTYGTFALAAGSSNLATGSIYLQYE